jgi:uroporphyrin-III C-methyltransferase
MPHPDSSSSRGFVHFVGAGPGDPDLLTVKAARLLGQAEVVLIDDLAGEAVLALCPEARVIRVGKRGGCASTPQAFIERLMVHEARAGRRVVRLKGGDAGLFGRLAEEIAALDGAGIPWEVVPGITAGVAAAASLGVSLTHRVHAHGVAFITGHGAEGRTIDWRALAGAGLTLVAYMAVARAAELACSLLEGGLPADTPVIAVERAASAAERRIAATVGTMVERFAAARLTSPAVLLIGEALAGAAAAAAHPTIETGALTRVG